jgi:hypothetical protein
MYHSANDCHINCTIRPGNSGTKKRKEIRRRRFMAQREPCMSISMTGNLILDVANDDFLVGKTSKNERFLNTNTII